jgi:hypothetical protein
MSRKSCLTQSALSVRRVLTAYNACPIPPTTVSRVTSSLFEAKRELSAIATPNIGKYYMLRFVFRQKTYGPIW